MKHIDGIVYTSNAGHTKEYALLLSEILSIPAIEASDFKVSNPTSVLYMGWLMAGEVKGYKKAKERYDIEAVCAVGMTQSDSQIQEIREKNSIPTSIQVFYLPGGFDMNKLKGIYKLMMKTMKATVGKNMEKKEDISQEEKDLLDMMINGKNLVDSKYLVPIVEWVKE